MKMWKKEAYEILDIIQKIYQKQEIDNTNSIFKDKVFKICTDDNQKTISIVRDYEIEDSSYYFEAPEIIGVIIKKENGNFCVKSAVKYTNANNQDLWFAKIRIEKSFNKDIKVMGNRYGSWEKPDYEDKNLLTNMDLDFLLVLDSMKNYLVDIYNQLSQSNGLNSDLYDPKCVKKLKKYNN